MTDRRTPQCRTESVKLRRDIHPLCRRATSSRTLALLALGMILLPSAGCRSLRPSDGEGLFASRSSLLSTDSIRGPLERALWNDEDSLSRGEKFSPEAMRRVELARKQFDDQNYVAAIKSYDTIAGKYPESSIGEEAWFRMGESHFALKQYPKAQDAYSKLFKDYPSTKYVADASERMFTIAKVWLEVVDPIAKTNIKTVSDEKVLGAPASPPDGSRPLSARYGLIPNFFDKTRPILDTRGRAREALKSIWLNDPTGPLADDALMLTATYYLKKGNHLEADRYFEILREEYPDSPHLEDAFVLGAHVKQISYQGPFYDGTTLVSAENLKQRTLTMFPNSKDREQVRDDLNRIYLLQAQRAWSEVDLWSRKNNPRAVAIRSMQLINDFPDTRYADYARRELLQIDRRRIQDLPGMVEFLDSLPTEPIKRQNPEEQQSSENPVKSVSDEKPKRRMFGI